MGGIGGLIWGWDDGVDLSLGGGYGIGRGC